MKTPKDPAFKALEFIVNLDAEQLTDKGDKKKIDPAKLLEFLKARHYKSGLFYLMAKHPADDAASFNHIHVYMEYRSARKLSEISNSLHLPQNAIQRVRGSRDSVIVYYAHQTPEARAEGKTPIDPDSFICSEKIDFDAVLERYTSKRTQADKKATHSERLAAALEAIEAGTLTELEFFKNPENSDLYTHDAAKIDRAFEFHFKQQRAEFFAAGVKPLTVLFFEGPTSTGKTTFAERICRESGATFYKSGSSRDPLQDYKGEEVLILDDLRDTVFNFADLLKFLDSSTRSGMSSRYKDKTFFGSLIIITSSVPLSDWFQNLPNSEDVAQFRRRISQVWTFTRERITVQEHALGCPASPFVFSRVMDNPQASFFRATPPPLPFAGCSPALALALSAPASSPSPSLDDDDDEEEDIFR